MNKKSRLHIPRPTARPGDKPDFSYLELSPAGSVDRPSIDARTRDIEWLSAGLVRVLDEDLVSKVPPRPRRAQRVYLGPLFEEEPDESLFPIVIGPDRLIDHLPVGPTTNQAKDSDDDQ